MFYSLTLRVMNAGRDNNVTLTEAKGVLSEPMMSALGNESQFAIGQMTKKDI